MVHTLESYRNNHTINVARALSVPASAWRDLRWVHYWIDHDDKDSIPLEVHFSQNHLIQDETATIARRLASQCPYMVPWESVQCQTVDGTIVSPATLNGCIVGLCVNGDQGKLNSCVGMGIVRSVNVVSRLLYVLTPVLPTSLGIVEFACP